jgi:hypothetical protein
MLDENFRTMSRRVQDLETELSDKTDKLEVLQSHHETNQQQVNRIYDAHEQKTQRLEKQYLEKLEEKEREVRKCRIELQQHEHQVKLVEEQCNERHRQEIDVIQDKVQQALIKKRQQVEQLQEELRVKEIHVIKLKEVIDKQRAELLK